MRLIAAAITTAARAEDGRYAVTPGASRVKATIRPAPTTPTSCVRAPACSATGVRDEDADTGNPPKDPEAMFATPIAAISWLPLTCSPRRAAKVRDRTPVSANAMNAMPNAGPANDRTSAQRSPPSCGEGNPLGSAPTTASSSSQPRTATRTVGTTTANRIAGSLLPSRRGTKITSSAPRPIANDRQLTALSASPSKIARISSTSEVASVENPSNLGSCPTSTTTAMPLR